jgi:exodeoxyribonuclease VII large subunit
MINTNKNRFYNLSAITTRIQEILQPHIGTLFWVKTEISSSRERGGSFYCDLVESDECGKVIALMRCTLWNRDLSNIRKQFKEHDLDLILNDGTVVGFQCSLQFHPQFGLSLKAVGADPAFALGELELKRKEILNRLTKEGLLESNKRLMVPMLPRWIGLITSKGSAACDDILKTFSASGFGFNILLADSTVQGSNTEKSVLAALDVLERLNLDLVIIARGGGSKTDLFYLDNEAIARRIAGYKYPIWTSIGHETDISILDHVANRYFKTPTAVAENIVASYVEMKRHLEEGRNMLRSTWAYRFDRDKFWLDEAKVGIVQGTRKLIESTKGSLLGYATSLSSKVQNRLANEKLRIAVAKNLITTVPISLIKREQERIDNRTGGFRSGYKREMANKLKYLTTMKKRFQSERFFRRISQEKECLYDWKNRYIQRFMSELQIKRQHVSLLSGRFRLDLIVSYLKNEKSKLLNKSATLRAADPDTSLKRGFALVYSESGELVKSLSQIKIADTMKTKLSDGRFVSTVNRTEREFYDRET